MRPRVQGLGFLVEVRSVSVAPLKPEGPMNPQIAAPCCAAHMLCSAGVQDITLYPKPLQGRCYRSDPILQGKRWKLRGLVICPRFPTWSWTGLGNREVGAAQRRQGRALGTARCPHARPVLTAHAAPAARRRRGWGCSAAGCSSGSCGKGHMPCWLFLSRCSQVHWPHCGPVKANGLSCRLHILTNAS